MSNEFNDLSEFKDLYNTIKKISSNQNINLVEEISIQKLDSLFSFNISQNKDSLNVKIGKNTDEIRPKLSVTLNNKKDMIFSVETKQNCISSAKMIGNEIALDQKGIANVVAGKLGFKGIDAPAIIVRFLQYKIAEEIYPYLLSVGNLKDSNPPFRAMQEKQIKFLKKLNE